MSDLEGKIVSVELTSELITNLLEAKTKEEILFLLQWKTHIQESSTEGEDHTDESYLIGMMGNLRWSREF